MQSELLMSPDMVRRFQSVCLPGNLHRHPSGFQASKCCIPYTLSPIEHQLFPSRKELQREALALLSILNP